MSAIGPGAGRDPELGGQQLTVLGVDLLGDEGHFRSYGSAEVDEIRADPVDFLTSPTNLILGEGFAARWGVRLHDTIPLSTPSGRTAFHVRGFIRERRLGRALGGAIAVIDYRSAQVAFDRGDLVDVIDVAVTRGADRQAVRARLVETLGPGYTIDPPERRTERVHQMLAGFHLLLLLVSLLSLIVGLFLIHNTVFISAAQRKTEVGILRALGMTRGQVVALFVGEGTILGLVGSLLGVGLGLLLARAMLVGASRSVSELYLQVEPEQVQLDPMLIAAAFLVGVAGTMASSYGPARQASRAQPIEVLRSSNTVHPAAAAPASRRATDRVALLLLLASAGLALLDPVNGMPVFASIALGGVLLGSALLMPRVLLFLRGALRPLLRRRGGVELRLASENAARDIGRSAVSGGALMIAVSMVTALAVVVASMRASVATWVDQTLPADVFITCANPFAAGGRNASMSNEMYGFLRELPGTRAVDRMRITDLMYRDARVKLLSIDWSVNRHHGRFSYLAGGGDAADDAVMGGAGVLVSENFARRFDVGPGDPIDLFTPAGERRFQVAGVVVDYTSEQGLVLMDRAVYSAAYSDAKVDTYKLYLEPGADIGELRRRINARFGDRYTLYILSNAEFKGEIGKLLDQMFQLVDALQLVALLIAVLGVVNTMLAAVLDRTPRAGDVAGARRATRPGAQAGRPGVHPSSGSAAACWEWWRESAWRRSCSMASTRR